MKRIFPERRSSLAVILGLNLVVLVGLMVFFLLFLELSSLARWVLTLGTAVLIGFNWAMLSHATRGGRK